jgi:hypothetical protein
MARPVVGVFPDRVSAEHAIVDLKAAGFDPRHIGLLMQNRDEAKEAANDVGVNVGTGAVTGGILGGTLGAILAATGTFVIPGIGPFVSAGILATAIAGGAAGAIVGGLVGLGIPREEASYYDYRVQHGGVLVTIDPQGRDVEARELLLRNGAEDTWRTAPWNQPQSTWNAPTYGSGYDTTRQQFTGTQPEYTGAQPQHTSGTMPQRTAPITGPGFTPETQGYVDRGSVVGPNDAIQHGPVTDPYAGRTAQNEGPINYGEPGLGQRANPANPVNPVNEDEPPPERPNY